MRFGILALIVYFKGIMMIIFNDFIVTSHKERKCVSE
jgi:hypothetical protein